MPKEYRTIREVAGPLMMISDVDDVKYDELGEIELPNGETRRCRVLEVDGSNALVQLPQALTLRIQRFVFSAVQWSCLYHPICSRGYSTDSEILLTTVLL